MGESLSQSDVTAALALLERVTGGFETTPRRLTAFLEEFCETICESEPQWVPVITLPGAEPGRAARNVAAKIARSGGGAQHGWAIWENPGISVAASYHLVWRSAAGHLFDVTPAPHEAERILFLPDPRPAPDPALDPPPLGRVKWLHPELRARFRDAASPEAALRELLADRLGGG